MGGASSCHCSPAALLAAGAAGSAGTVPECCAARPAGKPYAGPAPASAACATAALRECTLQEGGSARLTAG